MPVVRIFDEFGCLALCQVSPQCCSELFDGVWDPVSNRVLWDALRRAGYGRACGQTTAAAAEGIFRFWVSGHVPGIIIDAAAAAIRLKI